MRGYMKQTLIAFILLHDYRTGEPLLINPFQIDVVKATKDNTGSQLTIGNNFWYVAETPKRVMRAIRKENHERRR